MGPVIAEPEADSRPRPPLQFGIRTLLAATAALAVLLGTLRWIDPSPHAMIVVAGIVALAAAAAVALAASLGRMA